MYRALFSRRAERAFLNLPQQEARRVRDAVEKLMQDPRGRGTIKLTNAPVAQFRYRVGTCRILFDLDDEKQLLAIVDIRGRSERAYR